MGLDYCHICSSVEETETIHIKEYDESLEFCENCRDTYFTSVPKYENINIRSLDFSYTAHDGQCFAEFTDLSKYLKIHPGLCKAKILNPVSGFKDHDTFMSKEDLFKKIKYFIWDRKRNHKDTIYLPNVKFWECEKQDIAKELERLQKRQKVANSLKLTNR